MRAEEDYGKFPGRAALVALVVGVDVVEGWPETSAFVPSGGFGGDVDAIGSEFDFGFRIGDEVQVPGGMRIGAVIGGNDSIGAAIFEVENRRSPGATGSAALGGDQKDCGLAPAADEAASEEPIDDRVEPGEESADHGVSVP